MNTRVEGNRVSIVIHSLVFILRCVKGNCASIVIHSLVFTLHCVNGNFFSIVIHSLMFSSTLCQRELFQYCHPLLDVHTYIVSKGTVSVLSSTPWSSHLHCVKWNRVCIVIHSLELTHLHCVKENRVSIVIHLLEFAFTLCERELCQLLLFLGVHIYIVSKGTVSILPSTPWS